MVNSCYCAACAVRLQFKILWHGYTKKLEKFTVSPTEYNPSVFDRELKNNYGSMPQLQTASPTEYNPSIFHKELKKNYGSVQQSLTESPTLWPTYIIDGLTDEIPTSRKRTHVRRVSVVQTYRRIFQRIEKYGGIFEIFWCVYQLIADGIECHRQQLMFVGKSFEKIVI